MVTMSLNPILRLNTGIIRSNVNRNNRTVRRTRHTAESRGQTEDKKNVLQVLLYLALEILCKICDVEWD